MYPLWLCLFLGYPQAEAGILVNHDEEDVCDKEVKGWPSGCRDNCSAHVKQTKMGAIHATCLLVLRVSAPHTTSYAPAEGVCDSRMRVLSVTLTASLFVVGAVRCW